MDKGPASPGRYRLIEVDRSGAPAAIPRVAGEGPDGRWSARIDALPGCAAWGYRRDEALKATEDAADASVADMPETGEPLPDGVVIIDAPVVTVARDAA